MDTLSNKALILLDLLKKLGAVDVEHKTNVYKIMEKLFVILVRLILELAIGVKILYIVRLKKTLLGFRKKYQSKFSKDRKFS